MGTGERGEGGRCNAPDLRSGGNIACWRERDSPIFVDHRCTSSHPRKSGTVPFLFRRIGIGTITGRVVSLTDYGAFVELKPGVEGLVHISEMSWSKRLRHPSKILKIDDHVDVGVLEVDMAKRRISLSLKASLPDPWTTISEKFAVGAVVQGRVRNLTEFGAFVEIEDGVDGLIHLTNISWNRNIKHPSEVLKKGQKVDAVVLALDPGNRRLALGLKQLEEDPWQSFFAKIHVGEMVHGKVSRQVSFGVFVELEGRD